MAGVQVAERGRGLQRGGPRGPRGIQPRIGVQLLDAEPRRRDRALRHEQAVGDDEAAGGGADLVDVAGERVGQQQDLRRDERDVAPRPEPDQGQPGDHRRVLDALDAAHRADRRGRPAHRRLVRRVTGEPQRDVAEDGHHEIVGTLVVRRPSAALGLLAEARLRRGARGVVRQAQEEAEHDVRGFADDAGLELSLPVSGGGLALLERGEGEGEGALHARVEIGDLGGHHCGHSMRAFPIPRGPGASRARHPPRGPRSSAAGRA